MNLETIVYDSPLPELNNKEEEYLKNMLNSINEEERANKILFYESNKDFAKIKLPIIGVIIMMLSKGLGNRKDVDNSTASLCVSCHSSIASTSIAPKSDAPKSDAPKSDAPKSISDWIKRIDTIPNSKLNNGQYNWDEIYRYFTKSAINGKGDMQPKGGFPSLTDEDVAEAVTYMLKPLKDTHEIINTQCVMCHSIPGHYQKSTIGPELIEMQNKFQNKEILKKQIYDPTEKNPNSFMPKFGKNELLTDNEIDLIVEYLYNN